MVKKVFTVEWVDNKHTHFAAVAFHHPNVFPLLCVKTTYKQRKSGGVVKAKTATIQTDGGDRKRTNRRI